MPKARAFRRAGMPGNPHVRFDEGRVGRHLPVLALSPTLLYRRRVEKNAYDRRQLGWIPYASVLKHA
jgi:hypothetical protein